MAEDSTWLSGGFSAAKSLSVLHPNRRGFCVTFVWILHAYAFALRILCIESAEIAWLFTLLLLRIYADDLYTQLGIHFGVIGFENLVSCSFDVAFIHFATMPKPKKDSVRGAKERGMNSTSLNQLAFDTRLRSH